MATCSELLRSLQGAERKAIITTLTTIYIQHFHPLQIAFHSTCFAIFQTVLTSSTFELSPHTRDLLCYVMHIHFKNNTLNYLKQKQSLERSVFCSPSKIICIYTRAWLQIDITIISNFYLFRLIHNYFCTHWLEKTKTCCLSFLPSRLNHIP